MPHCPRLRLSSLAALLAFVLSVSADPLRVLIVSDDAVAAQVIGSALQGASIMTATAATAGTLAQADAVVLHSAKFAPQSMDSQKALGEFAKRGGGLVAIHGGLAAFDVEIGKTILGGAWTSESQKFRNKMLLAIRTDAHPLTLDSSTFDLEGETLYDLSLHEGITVLGSAFSPKVINSRKKGLVQENNKASVFDIQPQLWAYEAADHRAVAILPGSDVQGLAHASIRALVARGLAWVAKRKDINEIAQPADLAALRYPAGGPRTGAEAIAAFKLQPGFKASVLATEPLINKPIAQQWDDRGRLWVAETPEYPNGRRPLSADVWKEGGVLAPGNYDRPARDKISILLSSKHDGILDQKQIFHEGLELITGFCFWKDGVIVVSQEKISWLRDTDGDGKADKEVILFGGFKPGDTHFVANHFIVAPDGWIYASNGGSATATRGTTDEVMARITSGTFRFRPDGSAIEQVASQGGNSFGNEVTSTMELFHGKATNGNPIQHVVLPETILAKAPGSPAKAFVAVNPGRPVARTDLPDRAPLLQIDQVGHYSSACGAAVYEGGAWPKAYQGTVFMAEPILDIIHHEKLTLKGPAYAGEVLLDNQEWLRSMDHWFCPVDMSFGPDGAMYILDFYTPVVAHNDTRGPNHSKSGASVRPDREHYFGRIYRIQHESAPVFAHPDLSKADAAALVAAFKHPSKVVRFNAIRLLLDRDAATQDSAVAALTALAKGEPMVEARIQALWALQRMGKLSAESLAQAASALEDDVRKNAFLVAEAGKIALPFAAYQAGIDDANARVRLAALRAIGAAPVSGEVGLLLVRSQANFTDDWSKAAATAAAAANPVAMLEALMQGDAATSVDFARSLAASLAGSADEAGRLRVVQAAAEAMNAGVAQAVLRELAVRKAPKPADRQSAQAALAKVLQTKTEATVWAAIPLGVLWTEGDDLASADGKAIESVLKGVAERLLAGLAANSAQPAVLSSQVRTLSVLHRLDARIIPAVGALIQKGGSNSVSPVVIESLANAGTPAAGQALLAGYRKSDGNVRQAAFAALISRADWAQLVLNALEAKTLSSMQLGPLQTSQLVRHPDTAVSQRAEKVFAALNGAGNKSKDDLIAKLRPAVEKSGDLTKGKATFAAVCSTCHQLEGVGYDFGPNLQGIGAHPVAELMVHILDPSRMVDDEHRTWNIKLKDDTQYAALIGSENTAVLKLKQPAGIIIEVKVGEVASRTRVETSLMPEGFEALGAEGLRDLIAYIRSTAVATSSVAIVDRFHLINLSTVFTADSREGLYASKAARGDNLPFVKFGQVTANGIPYHIADPAQLKDGKNVIVLKGGAGQGSYSRSFVQSVEFPIGLIATRIHMLGLVGGWGGHPGPAMTVDIHFLSGKKQTLVMEGGREFGDYNSDDANVPGSKLAAGLVKTHHVRTLTIPVVSHEIIDKLVLTSTANEVAPTTVAITVEVGGPANPPTDANAPSGGVKGKKGKAAAKAAAPDSVDSPRTTLPFGQKFGPRKAGQLRVLVAGAGSSHNFPKFFLGTDALTAKAAGYDVASTPNLKETLALLPEADLLLFSGNHAQFGTPDFQKAIRDFAAAGKGIVLLHAATWYNWPLETKYNDEFVCGGARGHGHSDFTFTVTQPAHPIMKDVPATFIINDESYNVELSRPEGAEVLGTIPRQNPKDGQSKILPSVWTVKYPGTKVVCIALGHDEKSHDHPAYQKLLLNSLAWVAQK